MIHPSPLIADAEWPPKNMLRLHEINGPGNFKAEMIFEFDKDGKPVEVEMCDIQATTKEEAAEQARIKWGWTSAILQVPFCPSPTASPRQSEWQMWGGNWEREIPFVKRPESSFPKGKRFTVRYETSFLTTKGVWTKPSTEKDFRLADSAEDALASVQAHLDDPHYFEPGFHKAENARVEPCPDVPAYYDIYCRFDGSNDIRKCKAVGEPTNTSE
jgi:hypothetical protein